MHASESLPVTLYIVTLALFHFLMTLLIMKVHDIASSVDVTPKASTSLDPYLAEEVQRNSSSSLVKVSTESASDLNALHRLEGSNAEEGCF
jgi:hypothetical protein